MNARQIADLIDLHAPALVLFARQWCASPEDVVQESFCKLAALSSGPDDPVAWMYRAVRNRAIDSSRSDRRRQRREASVARPVQWFAESAIQDLDASEAVAALQDLPLDEREVIIARLWGGRTLEQIATVVGCSLSTVHRRFESGISRLSERLGVPCRTKFQ